MYHVVGEGVLLYESCCVHSSVALVGLTLGPWNDFGLGDGPSKLVLDLVR